MDYIKLSNNSDIIYFSVKQPIILVKHDEIILCDYKINYKLKNDNISINLIENKMNNSYKIKNSDLLKLEGQGEKLYINFSEIFYFKSNIPDHLSVSEYLAEDKIVVYVFGSKIELSGNYKMEFINYLDHNRYIRFFDTKTNTFYFINPEQIAMISSNPFTILSRAGKETLKFDLDPKMIETFLI